MATQPGTIDAAFERMKANRSEQEQPTDDEPPEETFEPDPPATEGDDAQIETEEEAVEDSEEEQPEAPTFEVTVNGETIQVTEEDLRTGYMMQKDYTSKTQQVAEGRRELEAAREEFNAKVAMAEDVAKLELEDLESASALELKDLDPTEFYQRKERVEAKQKQLDELRRDRDGNLEAEQKAYLQEQTQLTLARIPEWLDQEAADKDIKLMAAMWRRDGIPDEELNSPRFQNNLVMVYSRKAALYDELMSAKPEGKKVRTAPKTATPGSATEPVDRRSQREKKARDRLSKTGSMRAAQELLRARRNT